MLPILHLNGYKIANPTVLARIGDDELTDCCAGYGYEPYLVEGDDPDAVHQALAATLDARPRRDRGDPAAGAPARRTDGRPRWPMIVLRTPKGWTGPAEVDGVPVEGTWRAHQVPLAATCATNPTQLRLLEDWMRSYRPEELFDADGRPRPTCRLAARAATGGWAPTRTPTAALLLATLDAARTSATTRSPSTVPARRCPSRPRVLGAFLRDVIGAQRGARNFRLFGPDETASNRLDAVFEATDQGVEAEVRDRRRAPGAATAG